MWSVRVVHVMIVASDDDGDADDDDVRITDQF